MKKEKEENYSTHSLAEILWNLLPASTEKILRFPFARDVTPWEQGTKNPNPHVIYGYRVNDTHITLSPYFGEILVEREKKGQ